MFPRSFSLFSLKRKRSSIEETPIDVDESSDSPIKGVRIVGPSSNNEEHILHSTPVQAACTIRDENEKEEWEVLEHILPRGVKVAEAERVENEVEALATRLREENRIFSLSVPPPPLEECTLGLEETTSPSPFIPIFIRPPRPQTPVLDDALPDHPPSPRRLPVIVDFISSPTIRASLQHIRPQYDGVPAHLSEADVDALDDDSESGDADLALSTEMMQPWRAAFESPRSRHYPVYAEDLDLPEPEVDTRVIICEDVGSASVSVPSDEEEDEETPEERVREGEAEDGVD